MDVMDVTKALVGKTIKEIFINEDQSVLVFVTDGGDVILQAEGDCCSESWFADLLGVDCLLGQIVTAVEEVEMPDYNVEDGRGRQEEDQAYGYRFTTARGYADLIFRNSSNGYYGGWLELASSRPQILTAITADWKA